MTDPDLEEVNIYERPENEELYRTLARAVEQSASSVAITDSEGLIEYVNPKFCEITGYDLEEVIGRNPHKETGSQFPDIFGDAWNTVTTGGEWRGERQCRRKNGGTFWESVTISQIRNGENEISHFLVVREDISARKKAEYDLHKNKAELLVKHEQLKCVLGQVEKEKIEKENTMAELEKAYSDLKATQAKVVQQEKMASIGQLAAGVAHEINNPMGFISSNLGTLGKYIERMSDFIQAKSEAIDTLPDREIAEALRDKRKSLKIDYILEDGRDLIRESLDGAERVRTIVQNMKSFSRVDEAECKPADINECIVSTINIVWNELKYKASLIKELGDIPLTGCHPQQINQVIMNLLVNASHAIEERGEITVRTWHGNGSIFISVSDTGCGMPPEVINRIFEPFYTTKEVGKGTGLGLSITYDIVKGHNGEITVESEPGKGTTFTVRLPIVEGE
jgi:two-component system NtrC family sensor kinase